MKKITVSGGNLSGMLKLVPGLGAAFQPLKHAGFPGQNFYRNDQGGLNFEHVMNGTEADEKINWFTPRTDVHKLVRESASSATVIHEASDSSWGIESRMTYTMSGGNGLDMVFRVRMHEDRFPLGYVAFMWASYMNRTRGRKIHFWGELDGEAGWLSFGDDTADGFETGTVAAVGVPALTYEPRSATLNVVENERKRFVHPFYYGLVDGDGNLATTDDDMAYVMMFDQCEPIRFALWNFIEDDDTKSPDPHSPAWDWQYVIRNPTIRGRRACRFRDENKQWYGYRARLEYVPFSSREDILHRYEVWSESLLLC